MMWFIIMKVTGSSSFSKRANIEISNDTKWALRELVECLSRLGYSEYISSFIPFELPAMWNKWGAYRKKAPNKLYRLLDLFLLNQAVPPEMIKELPSDLIELLCNLGVMRRTRSGWLRMCDLILIRLYGNWLFVQPPQTNPKIYYGDDSVALLTRLQPKRKGKCLDLCAGAGIQSLYCSLFASHTVAVEINPEAAKVAQLNVLMNDREDSVMVCCGDLYEPVAGEVFDTVVCNPPFIPFPENMPYPFVGHGGADGLRVIRHILNGLPSVLASGGTAQLIGTCLSDGTRPFIVDELKGWAESMNMDILMTVTSHKSLAPHSLFFRRIVWSSAIGMKIPFHVVKAEYERMLIKQGASHLCAYFLYITKGIGHFALQDLSMNSKRYIWFVG